MIGDAVKFVPLNCEASRCGRIAVDVVAFMAWPRVTE